MSPTVLCVDDEPSMLVAYLHFLGSKFTVTTANGGEEALTVMAERGPFAVVLSDLQMPGMTGIRLLATIREKYPDTVRMLLTGNTDLNSAIEAVNTGQVFQFLTKPCSPATLNVAVAAAVAQHELIISDRRRVEEALHASDERYRLLFDANPYPMWVHDAKTERFLAVNEAAVRQYGYSRAELLAMSVKDISPDTHGNGQQVAGSGGHGTLHRHRHASGELRRVEVATNPIWFDERSANLVLVVDVTERKLLEDQLKQAQKLESIGQLAAGIAHEINTPIQYIGDNTNFLSNAFRDLSGVLTLYRAAGDDAVQLEAAARSAEEADVPYLLEEAPRAIHQTLEGVRHVARIVKAMKEFAHPGTEEKTPVDLNQAIKTVIAVARNEWKYAAEVVTDLDTELPTVPGLAGELNQVFLNLLVNAAHAIQTAGPGGAEKGTITISTRRVGNSVEVRIADTGSGIPEAIRGRIFDPFFTTKPVGQGTGQGLAITHAVIVQRHGGAITFESAIGSGTTFVVALPIEGDRLTQSARVKMINTLQTSPTVEVLS